MASEFFIIILAGRNTATGKSGLESTPLVQGEEFQPNLSLPKEQISRKKTVAVGKEFLTSQKGNLVTKDAHSGVKKLATGM